MGTIDHDDKALMELVDDLTTIPEVEAILLGGSRARGGADSSSDYDVYVYASSEIPAAKRKAILDRHLAPDYELDNRFWETEDDGILAADNVPIDIVYRSLDWLAGHLDDLLDRSIASTGYSTCMWRNLNESRILFDRDGRAAGLQLRADVPYPDKLVDAIINKNRPLLAGTFPCYRDQIAKAVSRGDLVSVNHRLAAWLESYFDILFAANRIAHPGEKKIPEYLGKEAGNLPEGWESGIAELISASGNDAKAIPSIIDRMVAALDAIL